MNAAEYREALEACVKCGSCKAKCPTYDARGVESMGSRGRLRLLLALEEGELEPSELLMERIFSCALCGMCSAQCPPGIDIADAIYHGRHLLAARDKRRRLIRRLSSYVLKRPGRAAAIGRAVVPLLKLVGAMPFDVTIPPGARTLPQGRRIIAPSAPDNRKRGRVALFAGCSSRYLEPGLSEAICSILSTSGYEVVTPELEQCCGAPLRAMGLSEDAGLLAEENEAYLKSLGADHLVSPCPTCALEIKGRFGPGMPPVTDVTELVIASGIEPAPGSGHLGKVAYHDPCHLRFGLGVADAPRKLLKSIGIELVEPRTSGCCGFSLAITHRGLSDDILMERVEAFRDACADTVVTACPGCAMQLRRGGLNVVNTVELFRQRN